MHISHNNKVPASVSQPGTWKEDSVVTKQTNKQKNVSNIAKTAEKCYMSSN